MPPAPPSQPVVGRLAPSPTGGLHIGHARTFLAAWLAARAAGGRLILRIEDLDASRVRPEAVAGAIADLRWLGLDWDEGPEVGGPHAPYVQSERRAAYAATLDRIRARELVYPCTCTRADVARAASAPHAGDEGPVYPGTCAGRRADDADDLNQPFAWRFRVEALGTETLAWSDLFQGPMSIPPDEVGGDFLVGRSGGEFAYQLAVVHDDAAMGVNQVIRGDDLIPSTPRQLLLYRALGGTPPTFGHLPLVVDADGRRLAKRDASLKLATLRAAGVNPRRLIGRIAWSCGWAGRDEPVSPPELVGRYDPGVVPSAAWTLDLNGIANDRGATTDQPAGP